MKKILVSVMVLAAVFAAGASAKITKTKAAEEKPAETAADDTAGANGKRKTQFEKMDANSNGAVDKKEFDTYYDGRFKKLDKNKDSKITKDEMLTRKKPEVAAQ